MDAPVAADDRDTKVFGRSCYYAVGHVRYSHTGHLSQCVNDLDSKRSFRKDVIRIGQRQLQVVVS